MKKKRTAIEYQISTLRPKIKGQPNYQRINTELCKEIIGRLSSEQCFKPHPSKKNTYIREHHFGGKSPCYMTIECLDKYWLFTADEPVNISYKKAYRNRMIVPEYERRVKSEIQVMARSIGLRILGIL